MKLLIKRKGRRKRRIYGSNKYPENFKNFEKNKEISKDESFKFSDQVQEITDKLIEQIELLFSEKEKDILRV